MAKIEKVKDEKPMELGKAVAEAKGIRIDVTVAGVPQSVLIDSAEIDRLVEEQAEHPVEYALVNEKVIKGTTYRAYRNVDDPTDCHVDTISPDTKEAPPRVPVKNLKEHWMSIKEEG